MRDTRFTNGIVSIAAAVFLACGCGPQSGVTPQAGSPAPAVHQADGPAEQNALPEPGTLVAFPPVPILAKGDANANDLLADGGFEKPLNEEPRAWSFAPADGVPVTQAEDVVAEGSRALKVDAGEAKSFMLTQSFEVPAQSRYELIGLALPRNLDGSLKLVAKDASGSRYAVESGPAPGNSPAWSQMALKIAAPAFVNELSVGLEYIASAQKVYDGPSAFSVDRFKLVDRGAPVSMLQNGDFTSGATGMDGWNSAENLEIAKVESGFTPDTPTCIRINIPGNRNLGVYRTVGGLEPGKRYVCRGYIKCETLAGEACIELQHGVKGFKEFMQRTEKLTGTQDWTWVRTEFVATEGMTSVSVFLRRPAGNTGPDTPGTVWFARCELFAADAAG